MSEIRYRCPDCDEPYVEVNIRGRKLPWRQYDSVEIKRDLFFDGCPNGHDFCLPASKAVHLDAALGQTVCEQIESELTTLKSVVRDLAGALEACVAHLNAEAPSRINITAIEEALESFRAWKKARGM